MEEMRKEHISNVIDRVMKYFLLFCMQNVQDFKSI